MVMPETLAQLAEHLTFNQVVRGSNLRWLTKVTAILNRIAVTFLYNYLQTEANYC